MTTDKKLIKVAAALLDSGGEDAVTLRAVGHAAGLSHNAPYKHFESRADLLAGVAIADFEMLTDAVKRIRSSSAGPTAKLLAALDTMIGFSTEHPARYRLLFDDPDIAARKGAMKDAAMAAFEQFAGAVRESQSAGELPAVPTTTLTGLIFATLHGLIGLKGSGRMHPEKGLAGIGPSLGLLIELLSSRAATGQPPTE